MRNSQNGAMSDHDFELDGDGTVRAAEPAKKSRNWGGARPNSGPKPKGYKPPPEKVELDVERAQHERIKRQRAEFDFEVQKGNYVPRDVVRQATATIFSGMVQTMRSLSDNLERQGVAPELCVKVDAAVNEVLAQVGQDLQMIGGVD